jgi:hypothetical protein
LPLICSSFLIKFIVRSSIVFLFCLLYPFQDALAADAVTLVNGDRLTGQLLERKGNRLIFQTKYAGKIEVLWEHVQSLKVEEPALLLFDDGTTRSVLLVEVKKQNVMYQDSVDQQLHSINAHSILGISPEAWMENKSGLWSGQVNFSVKTERGNGDEGYVDVDADVTYRRKIDRVRLTGELENDSKVRETTDEIITTKDKWLLNGNYNYFLNKKIYLGALASLEHDPLADLDLRATAGPLAGYQFFESKPLNLKVEAGMLLVNEDYRNTANERNVRPAWHIDFNKYIIETWLQFYHEQYGVVGLNNEDQWFFRCWTGFRLPLAQGIQVTAEYKLDYDHHLVGRIMILQNRFSD